MKHDRALRYIVLRLNDVKKSTRENELVYATAFAQGALDVMAEAKLLTNDEVTRYDDLIDDESNSRHDFLRKGAKPMSGPRKCHICGNQAIGECVECHEPMCYYCWQEEAACIACTDPELCKDTHPEWWAERLQDQADHIRKAEREDG